MSKIFWERAVWLWVFLIPLAIGGSGLFDVTVNYNPAKVAITGGSISGTKISNLVFTGTNTGTGINALINLTTGTQNTAFGYDSLMSLTTGNHNYAAGYYSGQALISGLDNIFIGANAGDTMTGSHNDVVGYFSGDSRTTGNYNTIFGDQAGIGPGTGSNNSLFGATAGSGLSGTDSNNTIIGEASGTPGMSANILLSDGLGNIRYQFDGINNLFPSGNLQSAGKITLTHSDITAGAAGVAITAGASPFSYTATYAGSVAISAGTVSAVTLTRATVVVWSTTLSNEVIPMRAGDVVTVTYTVAPTMYQLTD